MTSHPVPPLPSLADLVAAAHVVRVPMRVRFRGVLEREALLLHGPNGWGEFAPFPEYEPAEASRWLAAAVEAGWSGWPEPVRAEVEVNATVPAVTAAEVEAVLAGFDGCRTAKVKVAEAGQTLADDVARVAEVRRLMGPGARVRVDANGGWSVAGATDALASLTAYDLEYAEQPCATVEELAELRVALARKGIDVPIAADESVRKAEDPLRVVRARAADVVVVKVAPLGGVAAALEVARACGVPVVVSSALDTSVGIAAGVALAAALPALPFACGLGTVSLMATDVCDVPSVPRGGRLTVGAVTPSPERLAALAAPPDRREWWLERLAACHAVLSGGRLPDSD